MDKGKNLSQLIEDMELVYKDWLKADSLPKKELYEPQEMVDLHLARQNFNAFAMAEWPRIIKELKRLPLT